MKIENDLYYKKTYEIGGMDFAIKTGYFENEIEDMQKLIQKSLDIPCTPIEFIYSI